LILAVSVSDMCQAVSLNEVTGAIMPTDITARRATADGLQVEQES